MGIIQSIGITRDGFYGLCLHSRSVTGEKFVPLDPLPSIAIRILRGRKLRSETKTKRFRRHKSQTREFALDIVISSSSYDTLFDLVFFLS